MANFSIKTAGQNIFGTHFTEPTTAMEALTKCGADFNVGLQPIIAANDQLATLLEGGVSLDSENTKLIDGQQFVSVDMLRKHLVQGYNATVRKDTNQPLGLVSNNYGVVQYKDCFEYLDLLTTGELGTKIDITSAGSLLGGRRAYLQAKFPEPIRMAGNNNDVIDMYITISSSHDGSGAVVCAVTPIRVACLNSLMVALSKCASKITFRHTSNVMNRMDLLNKQNADMAYRTLKLYETYKGFFEGALQDLADIRLTEKQMEEVMVKSVLSKDVVKLYKINNSLYHDEISTRSRNIIDNIMQANEVGVGQDIIGEKNTGLSLFNALSTYYQNHHDWKDSEKKYLAISEGSVQQKMQNLYDNLMLLKTA